MSIPDRNRKSRCSTGRSMNGKRRHKRAQQISRDTNSQCLKAGHCRAPLTKGSHEDESRNLSAERENTLIPEMTGSGKQLLIGK